MRSNILFFSVIVISALSTQSGLDAQTRASVLPRNPAVLDAWLAWDRGDYPEALRGYIGVLESDASVAVVREIAGRTGEVFHVTEVASDGRGLTMGPAGVYATYSVQESGATVTRVIEVKSGRIVTSLNGTGAALSADGRVAYLAPGRVTQEHAEAQRVADAAQASGDRRAFFAAARGLQWHIAASNELRVRDLDSGREDVLDTGSSMIGSLAFHENGSLYAVFGSRDGTAGGVLELSRSDATPIQLPPGFPSQVMNAGPHLVVVMRSRATLPAPAGTAPASRGMNATVLVDFDGEGASYPEATDATVSSDGSRLAFLRVADEVTEVITVDLSGARNATVVHRTSLAIANIALSPDGSRVAFQQRPDRDWEVYAARSDGSGEVLRLSDETQHDRYPRWVGNDWILAAKGEGRHMRSYLYPAEGGNPLKLFHNNTVRTIAPEYEWTATPDGSRVMIVSERDGDTVSPERAVYLVDLTRPVTRAELVDRLQVALEVEEDLRARGAESFRLIANEVRLLTEQIDVSRIYGYATDLYHFGSKFVTQPGNALAIEYLVRQLTEWGYEPEVQWFEPRGFRSGNVVVRIPGTVHPELVYVVSSHFDSVERGPGTDDNSSGTTALLEVARVLKGHPMPATIELAFFTGEEAGLLGSREYVRRAVESGKNIAGALNNDMVGWAHNPRLDNTIRYSNPGIRDIQHAAAMIFSELITYDALYYKSTDAHAYYEEYGDIVGGIGSYPVLGNPNYHQVTDRLETINHQLVAEVGRTTAATIMLLASAPARLKNVRVSLAGDGTHISFPAAPESDIVGYLVKWRDASGEVSERRVGPSSGEVSTTLPALPAGAWVSVKAINRSGHLGWDWATVRVGG